MWTAPHSPLSFVFGFDFFSPPTFFPYSCSWLFPPKREQYRFHPCSQLSSVKVNHFMVSISNPLLHLGIFSHREGPYLDLSLGTTMHQVPLTKARLLSAQWQVSPSATAWVDYQDGPDTNFVQLDNISPEVFEKCSIILYTLCRYCTSYCHYGYRISTELT